MCVRSHTNNYSVCTHECTFREIIWHLRHFSKSNLNFKAWQSFFRTDKGYLNSHMFNLINKHILTVYRSIFIIITPFDFRKWIFKTLWFPLFFYNTIKYRSEPLDKHFFTFFIQFYIRLSILAMIGLILFKLWTNEFKSMRKILF